MWDEVYPKEVAGMIEILISNRIEEHQVNPKCDKCKRKFERIAQNFLQQTVQTVKYFVAGKSPINLPESICLKLIELTFEESIKYSRQKYNHPYKHL